MFIGKTVINITHETDCFLIRKQQGFKPEEGHRVVEIGAVEMVRGAVTGNTFHVYVNPERDMPIEAYKVTRSLSGSFLSDKPLFTDPSIGQAFSGLCGWRRTGCA